MLITIRRITWGALSALLALSMVSSGVVWAFPFITHASGVMEVEQSASAGGETTNTPGGSEEEKPGEEPDGGCSNEPSIDDDMTAADMQRGGIREEEDGSGDKQNANGNAPPDEQDTGGRDILDGYGTDIAKSRAACEQEESDREDQEYIQTLDLAEALCEQEEPEREDQEPEGLEDVVYDEAEFAAWCRSNKIGGGRVILGAVVTMTDNIDLRGCGNIVIDTGRWGLVYDGGAVLLYGYEDLEIIGEGVDVPVLDIYDVGGSWNIAVQPLRITAIGRDGVGGITLRVRAYDGYDDFDTLSARNEGQIRSYGDGAIGLYLDDIVNAYCLNIAVEGKNSISVYAAWSASLFYCKLSARGEDANCAVCGSAFGFVILDACSVSPDTADIRVLNRKITSIIGRNLYWPVKQYEDIVYDSAFRFNLSGFDFAWVDLLLDLGGAPEAIDTGALGRTVIQAKFYPPFQGLGLEDDFPLEIVVDVRDPTVPCITDMKFVTASYYETYLSLAFWESYDPSEENVILWRSDDGGDTWYNFTYSPDIEWHGDSLYFYFGEITDPILLQLEYVGAGESNVVRLYSDDKGLGGGFEGDRTGTDRVVVGNNDENGAEGNGNDQDDASNADGDENDPGADEQTDAEDDARGDFQTGAGKSETPSGDGKSETPSGVGKSETPSGDGGSDSDSGNTNNHGEIVGGGASRPEDNNYNDRDRTQDGKSGNNSGIGNFGSNANKFGGETPVDAKSRTATGLTQPEDTKNGAATSSTQPEDAKSRAATGSTQPENAKSRAATGLIQPEDEAFTTYADNALAAAPFAETAFAAVFVNESLSVLPEPETGEQSISADTSAKKEAKKEYAATTPEPDVIGSRDVSERVDAESSLDAHSLITLSGLATILFAGAYILLRLRGARRRKT